MFIKYVFIFLALLIFICNCSNYKPLYKTNIDDVHRLQDFIIISDKKIISEKIKKQLLTHFPVNLNSKYIIEIKASIKSYGNVSEMTGRISRYTIENEALVNIYLRKKNYDKLIYSFNEIQKAPYSLIANNVRSTLANRNEAEMITIMLLSEIIYKRLLLYLLEE